MGNMKFGYGSIVFVLAIFAAVMVAGCTFSKTIEIGSTGTPTPGAQSGTATPAATTSPGGPSVDFDSIKVLEYKMSSTADGQTTTMNMRWELEPTVVKMKISMEGMGQPMEFTVPRDQASKQQGSGMMGDVMDADFNTRLVNAGPDSVTVPKGTFACTKYTVTDGNVVSTYWISPNVPLPVKMISVQDGKQTMSMELVDFQV
jgi:hypothetical protein